MKLILLKNIQKNHQVPGRSPENFSVGRTERQQFTSRAEADKAVNSLRGILEGMLMDGKINDQEVNELQKWCEHHQRLDHMNPFRDFILSIRHRLIKEPDPKETLEDLYWAAQQYQESNIYYNAITCDMQTLQGICHGILADGIIEDEEIDCLHEWMEQNRHLADLYPYAELHLYFKRF